MRTKLPSASGSPQRSAAAGLVVLAAALAAPAAHAAPGDAAGTVLHCPHLLDPQSGQMLGEQTVITDGKKVTQVLPGTQSPAGLTVIELTGQTCLPGLIDSHTHLTDQTSPSAYVDQFHWNPADYAVRAPTFARRTLLAGFTTVRNLGAPATLSEALRNAINSGAIAGPRIFTAGEPIGSTGGHADPTDGYRLDLQGAPATSVIDSPEAAVKAVRLHYKAGDDVIKIMPSGGVLDESASGDNPQMTLEEIRAVVSTAHDYGMTVAAHAHGAEGIRRAVVGGVDSIEHGTFLNDEDMRLMKEHGTWYVPTIIAGDFVAQKAKIPGYYPPQVAAKAAAIGPQILGTAARAYKAGVKIAFGTDAAVYPHGQNAHEFELLVRAGLPPLAALQAATTNAAALLRHPELGVVAAGHPADVIAVPGDPLKDISVMTQVSFVMKDGVVYKRDGRAADSAGG